MRSGSNWSPLEVSLNLPVLVLEYARFFWSMLVLIVLHRIGAKFQPEEVKWRINIYDCNKLDIYYKDSLYL